ncbi:DUF2184 domain-containing protein [Alysiella crassa]|uniref:Uncharacterized protein conserved in bacteria n=1 Tax=Alysiella crassa TaxID=153491 RepID=A0A376BW79_9NEIS|nr:major capsid family protein [Alysiella crassa]UOP06520.1 DUF2184 domain-containing protein [Alysiella crassa]SSY81053.1 Uncharacterized protein conserved in bacteria [Alysiella crassa]
MNVHGLHYDEADLPAMREIAKHIVNALPAAFHQDAESSSIFLASELDRVRAKLYETKYPNMSGLSLIPMTNEAAAWQDTITTQYFDSYGMAKFISNYADDLPRADVAGKTHTVKLHDLGDSYGYNYNEFQKSIATGKPLPPMKALAAHRGILTKLNQVALKGDKERNIFGLMTHPNMGVTTIPSGKDWLVDTMTAQELVRDVSAVIDAVSEQSSGVHKANKVIIPSRCFTLLKNTSMPNSDKSVLQYLKDEYEHVDFQAAYDFNSEGDDGYSEMFAGEFDVSNLSHEVPEPFMQHPAQFRNLETVVLCTAKTGGVVIHYPLAFTSAELSAQ